jgi:hypothetical protein
MKNKYDRKDKPFGNAFAIEDSNVVDLLNNAIRVSDVVKDDNVHTRFLIKYREWIQSTKNNTISGLEQFPYACFTNGTTEAFDKFYAKHSTRRFRFFKGEYVYHRLSCRNNNYDWKYIDDSKLDKNDVVIISLPFSDTGNKHTQLDHILDTCNSLDIPVLLDCAYFGICSGLDFNFTHKCIKEITFSLSKTFFSAHIRIGMRLSRQDDDDPLFVTNKMGYVNRLSGQIGINLLDHLSPDYIFDKYRQRQLDYCNILGVESSNCVLFGIGDDRWNDYNRDRETNRLSFHKFLADDCTSNIKNEKR